jgi:hypothetical protein
VQTRHYVDRLAPPQPSRRYSSRCAGKHFIDGQPWPGRKWTAVDGDGHIIEKPVILSGRVVLRQQVQLHTSVFTHRRQKRW